jgi:hypothetical protein
MIMFSQVGFPTINRHPRPDPVPMFVRCPRHRPQSGLWGFIHATGGDSGNGPQSGHELASVPSAAICAGLSRKLNKVDRCDDGEFRPETAQIQRISL